MSSSGQKICLWDGTAILLCSVCLDTNHPNKDEGDGMMPDILRLEMVSTSAQYCSKPKTSKVVPTVAMSYARL